jgi:hypothetical protein
MDINTTRRNHMKIAKKLVTSLTFFAVVPFLFLACIVVGLPIFASAQASPSAGANAVYSAPATGTPIPIPSTSFVDASGFTGTSGGTDVCAKINAVLLWSHYPPTSGTVVDARGIGTGTPQTCSINPFSGVSATTTSVVLLPPGVITINATWTPPSFTRIIGDGVPGPGGIGTLISAGGSLSGTMIQFPGTNSTTGAAFSVSVEDLGMSASNNASVSAIVNEFSQEHSYVRHVSFVFFTQPVLVIGQSPGDAGAQNSGPYEDLYFRSAADGCVKLYSNGTRGIHHMTCNGNNTPPPVGVWLDGANNMIEDAHFEGFTDGILIGSQAQASGSVISAVNGNSNDINGNMGNVVHISNLNTTSDLTLTGIRASAAHSDDTAPSSIKDDVTTTTLTDATVGMYALGEEDVLGGGGAPLGHARFTTSPSVPNWSVGSNIPGGTIACKTGGLYSNTAGTIGSHDTLYVCEGGSWFGK